MIPPFPKFKKLELSDKRSIEKIVSKFPPYSDFNFSSLWSWNIRNRVQISRLNKNLVVLFSDYLSEEQYLSFLGNSKVLDTTLTLLHFSKEKFNKGFLRLIPEDLTLFYKKHMDSSFSIHLDRDAADYIYLAEHLALMHEWRKNSRGAALRRTLEKYPSYKVLVKTPQGIHHKHYHELFHQWSQNKHAMSAYDLNEYKAFGRFLLLKNRNIRFISIYIEGVLAGFSVYELLPGHYAIAHFSKANTVQYPGIYDILNWEEARVLHKQGVKFLNWEQDLGIEGLRYAKEKYRPFFLMKKISINLLP